MAGPSVDIVVKKNLQLAQFKMIFRGPLIEDSIVDNPTDLLNLDLRYNYDHKLVWVKSVESYYYLIDGDGSQSSHWKKFAPDSTIGLYDTNKTYNQYDIVLLNYILYVANDSVDENESPTNTPLKWTAISAEIKTVRYVFEEVDSLVFYTDIKNPMFTCFMGDISKDIDDNYILDTSDGMILCDNAEEINPEIIRRRDIPDNALGCAYEISFIEDGDPVELSGIINIK